MTEAELSEIERSAKAHQDTDDRMLPEVVLELCAELRVARTRIAELEDECAEILRTVGGP